MPPIFYLSPGAHKFCQISSPQQEDAFLSIFLLSDSCCCPGLEQGHCWGVLHSDPPINQEKFICCYLRGTSVQNPSKLELGDFCHIYFTRWNKSSWMLKQFELSGEGGTRNLKVAIALAPLLSWAKLFTGHGSKLQILQIPQDLPQNKIPQQAQDVCSPTHTLQCDSVWTFYNFCTFLIL